MKTFLTVLTAVAILNAVLFAVTKLFDLVEPYILKLLFKADVTDMLARPEFKDRKKIRAKFTHWFWSTWIVLFYAISALNGINFYLALCGGLALYFIGSSESNALAELTAKHREEEYLEAQGIMLELQSQIKVQNQLIDEVDARDKEDDERN